MKVLIKRHCAAAGQHLNAGETYELPDNVARQLVAMGRATAVTGGDKADEPIQVRDPSIAARDPEIAIGDTGTKTLTSKRRK